MVFLLVFLKGMCSLEDPGGCGLLLSMVNCGLTLLEPTGWGTLKLECPKCKFCMNVAINLALYLLYISYDFEREGETERGCVS